MGRFWGWLWLAMVGSSSALAQQGNINVSVFRESATRGRADISWQIEPTVLHYQRVNTSDSLIAASYETELRIYKDTTLVKTDRWLTRTPPALPRQAAQLHLLDGYSQAVPPGKYRIELQCTEPLSPQTSFTLRSEFEVDTTRLRGIAAPQLLDTFYASPASKSTFARNGMMALPLVADFLGDENPLLHFYTEAYERPEMQKAKKPFRVESTILRGDVPLSRFSQTDTCTFRSGVAPLFVTMPIAGLFSGNFVLQTRLLDGQGKVWGIGAVFSAAMPIRSRTLWKIQQ